MNSNIQKAKAILGEELISFFKETCGNAKEFDEAISEALRAFRFAKQEDWWQDNLMANQE